MRIYKRGKVYWISWTENGLTERESTRCTTKDAAALYLQRRERELADPHHAAKDAATLSDSVSSFMSALRKTRRDDGSPVPEGTIDMYECKTGHLLRLLPPRLAAINVVSVEMFFETRDEEGAAPATLYKEWVALSRVLQLADKRDLLSINVRKLKPDWVTATSVARETFLTHDECSRLLSALPSERREVVAFILATGARWSEAMRFQPEDLSRATWTVRIRGTKTKGSAKPIVVPEMYRGLLDHVAGPFAPWPNVRRDLHAAARKADRDLAATLPDEATHCHVIPAVTPNDLRRTFASLLVQAGTPLDVVAKLLRHASTAMVYRVYGQHTPESLANLASGGASAGLFRVPTVYQEPRTRVENTDNLDVGSSPQPSHETSVLSGFRGGPTGERSRDLRIKSPVLTHNPPEKQRSRERRVRLLYQAPRLYELPPGLGRVVFERATVCA